MAIAKTDVVRYLGAIGIWLLIPLVVVSLPFDAPGLTCLAMLYLYLFGLCLAIALFVLFFISRRKPQAAAALVATIVLWLLSYWNGFAVGARLHLITNEARYAARIKDLSHAKSAAQKVKVCGGECMVLQDGPVVAFHYCHCPLFWPDIVYDPSGALDVDKNELRKINFYLGDARHLKTFWYIGYFGD